MHRGNPIEHWATVELQLTSSRHFGTPISLPNSTKYGAARQLLAFILAAFSTQKLVVSP